MNCTACRGVAGGWRAAVNQVQRCRMALRGNFGAMVVLNVVLSASVSVPFFLTWSLTALFDVLSLSCHLCSIPTQAPIWSVAWSQSNDQQLLLGLDRGRVALVDLRMTSDRALVFMTGRPTNSSSNIGAAAAGLCQPWHSLVMLPEGWQQQHAGASTVEGSVAPEALLACAGARVVACVGR